MSAPGGVDELDPTTTVRSGSDGLVPRCERGDEGVEHEEHVGLAGAEPVRLGVVVQREVEVAHHRPGLLRQPDLVEAAHAVAVEHRRGADDLGDRDHAGAADADHADRDVVGLDHDLGGGKWARRGARRRGVGGGAGAASAGVVVAADGRTRRVGHQRGRAVVSIVTNAGQSPSRHEKSRLQVVWSMRVLRPNGVSTGCTDRQLLFVAAVAAALADPLVDHHPEAGRGQRAALARPAVLGRARLVVDQHRHAGHLGEHLLRLDEASRCHTSTPRGELGIVVPRRVLGGDDDLAHAFEQHGARPRARDSWPGGSWPPVIATAPL